VKLIAVVSALFSLSASFFGMRLMRDLAIAEVRHGQQHGMLTQEWNNLLNIGFLR
jgi:hypothetical protein